MSYDKFETTARTFDDLFNVFKNISLLVDMFEHILAVNVEG